jgi:hypothetical protein
MNEYELKITIAFQTSELNALQAAANSVEALKQHLRITPGVNVDSISTVTMALEKTGF